MRNFRKYYRRPIWDEVNKMTGMSIFDELTEVKLEIFIPPSHLTSLRQALADLGAGRVGNYDSCCAVSEVRGYWRPLPGSSPYQGEVGQLETGAECKVEINCPVGLVRQALAAIRTVHPYEEPFINIIPLVNQRFKD